MVAFLKVTKAVLSKRSNNSQKLFPSSEVLGVGPFELACAMKPSSPVAPTPLVPSQEGRFSSLVAGLLVVGELLF